MTECYNPTDNAVAERMNGILKGEWFYHQAMFRDYAEALREIAAMIDFYNNIRPHTKKPPVTRPLTGGGLAVVINQ